MVVLGFGSTETDFERQEIDAFKDRVGERYRDLGCSYVTDELTEGITEWVYLRGQEYRHQTEQFKDDPDYPDRYSYFHAHITSSASAIVCIFTFMHINRRHGMAPDGWGLLRTEVLAHVFSYDIPEETDQ